MSSTFTSKIILKGEDKTKGAFGSVQKNVNKTVNLLTAATTALGAGFLVGAVRSASEFEEQIKKVQAVSGAFGDDLQKLKKVAENLGASTRFTATQAAQGLEELTRAGQSVSEAIATVPNALRLAQANAIELADAAQLVTTTLNQYALAADDSVRVSDVLTRATQKSAQNIEQLGNALEFAGPQARLMGLSLEETSAIIGKLADVGFRGEKGGTALRNALIELSDPASKFSGALKDLGITSTNMIDVLGQLEQKGGEANQAFIDLGKRAGPALQALVNGGTSGLKELITDLEGAAGTAKTTAEIMDDNLTGATLGLSSAFDALRRGVIEPVLEPLTDEVQLLTKEFRDLVSDGSAMRFGEGLRDVFKSAAISTKFLVEELDRLAPILAAITAGLLAISGPLGRIVLLFGSITAALTFFREEVANGVESLADLAEALSSKEFSFNPLKQVFSVAGLNDDMSELAGSLRDVSDRLRTTHRESSLLDSVFDKIKDKVGTSKGLFEKLKAAVSSYFLTIKSGVEPVDGLTDSQKELAESVDEVIDKLKEYDQQNAIFIAAQERIRSEFDSGTISLGEYLAAQMGLEESFDSLIPKIAKTESVAFSLFGHMEEGARGVHDEWANWVHDTLDWLDVLTDAVEEFQKATADAIQGVGGLFGIEIPGALAQDIAGRLPPGAGQVLQDMFAGAEYAGFGSQFVGSGSEDGAAIGGAIGSAFGPIGSAVGSIIGALIDGEDNPNSQIVTGSFPNRAASDDRIESPFGDVFVRSGADGFHQIQGQVTQAVTTLLTGLASSLTPEQIASVVLPSTFNIDQASVESGEFLEPFLDSVLRVMDPAIQSFVGQFEGLQTRLDALDVANFTFSQLDADPLQAFAELMAIAGESTMETMARLGDELGTLGDNAFNSIADMQALGVSLAEYNQFVIQSLAGIESARQNVSQIGSSTRDNLLFQTLDNPGQFEFLTRRANQLSAGIGELGTAAEVQSTVAQINQLLTQAFGLADPAQQAQLLEQFSGFSSATEAEAQARLDVLQAQIEERAEADRQAISDSVRQGVADGYVDAGFGDAAGVIGDAGNVIGLAGKQMQQAANTLVSTPLSVSISYSEIASVA